MARKWGLAIAVFAGIASTALAQEGSLARPATPAGEEGFFRPAPDPALTRFPTPDEGLAATRAGQSQMPADAQALAIAREAAERELDRTRQEHAQARHAAPVARPMIVSPLDGTAPIVSTLDGTAPVISPLGR